MSNSQQKRLREPLPESFLSKKLFQFTVTWKVTLSVPTALLPKLQVRI